MEPSSSLRSRPSLLPPISAIPSRTYPPSSYPPPSYFESESRVHPALVLPSRRTCEIQKRLGELVHREPKRKSVHPPEESTDYAAGDVVGNRYDPTRERKLVLARLGRSGGDDGDGDGYDPRRSIEDAGGCGMLREQMRDRVWRDPRMRSLLESSTKNDALIIGNDDNGAATTNNKRSTAPPGKCSVRPSYIRLPATPYPLLTVDQVLRRIIPTADSSHPSVNTNPGGNPVIEVPSSFEIAGHVAHVNLRSESLPYKYLIGRAILDKNAPRIRVVVNKVGTIENKYRTFPMEIIAGEGLDVDAVERLCAAGKYNGDGEADTFWDEVQIKVTPQHRSLMEVEVREHGCRFRLDFANVYFNSRLQGEHGRLVRGIVHDAVRRDANAAMHGQHGATTIVADAMAGVGPFAVPLTSANAPHYHQTRIVCHANDLNPISFQYLRENAKLNRCFSDRLFAYNMDARKFIHKMGDEDVGVDHFIMNLPQLGPEFLDAFRGWSFHDEHGKGKGAKKGKKRPMVHVHCFGEKARVGDVRETVRVEGQVRERCEQALGCPISTAAEDNTFRLRVVRDVGPRKNMLCASFRLPWAVAGVEMLALSTIDCNDVGYDSAEQHSSCGKRERNGGNEGAGDGDPAGTSHLSKKGKEL